MAVASSYRPAEQRHRWLQNLLLIGFLTIFARLFHLQVLARDYYLEEVAPLVATSSSPLGPRPGSILARDRQPLAESLLLKTLIANPRLMTDHGESLQATARQLAPLIERPEQEVNENLWRRRDKEYVELARFLPDATAKRIEALKVKGLFLRPEWKREYPHGLLACHLVGGRDRFHQSLAGLEHAYRLLLDPMPGASDYTRSSQINGGPGVKPEPGKSLLLTIDLGLQRQVENQMDRLWEQEHPRWASIVVVNPQTGEILAMGARPGYDPNGFVTSGQERSARTRISPAAIQNIPVVAAVEQGSTFKVLLTAAALDAGVVTPSSTFHCGGSISVGGRPISCWGRYAAKGHGTLDIYGMVGQSCNIIAAQVALRLGAPRYHDFLRRAGIGVDPEAGFPGEAFGLLPPLQRIRPRDLATMGFGQNVSCSNLQLTAAVSGIVNDGIMRQPHVVAAVLDDDGRIFRQPPVRETRLCSAATSAIVRQMLQYAVEHGTGAAVKMPDFRVGGKTGTAQQWDFANSRHFSDRYMVSFVEVAPIDRPRYVIHVACNEPQVGQHGADVAAPTARRIAEYVLRRAERPPAAAAPAAPVAARPTH